MGQYLYSIGYYRIFSTRSTQHTHQQNRIKQGNISEPLMLSLPIMDLHTSNMFDPFNLQGPRAVHRRGRT